MKNSKSLSFTSRKLIYNITKKNETMLICLSIAITIIVGTILVENNKNPFVVIFACLLLIHPFLKWTIICFISLRDKNYIVLH